MPRVKGCTRPSDTLVGTRVGSCCDLHAPVVVVDDGEVQLLVDRLAILGVRVAQDLDDALELADEILDLACGQPCSVATGPEGNLVGLRAEVGKWSVPSGTGL